MRRQGYSHCFVLPPSLSSAWMAWQARIRYRIGYGGQGRTVLLRPALWRAAPPRSVHLLEEYLGLLKPWLAARPEQYPPRLELTEAWHAAHDAPGLVPYAQPVVLAPGAEYGAAKQWPGDHYRALAQTLGQAGWPVVVTGLPGDTALGDHIVRDVPRALNLCGRTSLPQLVGVLGRAALLVSNDSGAMHLGAALGIRQVALFGSTDPVWTGPINAGARVLYRHESCSPCYARACRFGDTHCLADMPPASVAEEALALLAAAPKGN